MSTYFQNEVNSGNSSNNFFCGFFTKITTIYNAINDRLSLYRKTRWYIIILLSICYIIRLLITKGYQALTYCIGIHFLNSFIGFISPQIDPEDTGESYLPTTKGEEFVPFQRKVKEFQLWESMLYTLLIANLMTFFSVFDIPVFWPLLLFYFILVFVLTMRQQIKQMMKYNYLPWDVVKKEYNNNSK